MESFKSMFELEVLQRQPNRLTLRLYNDTQDVPIAFGILDCSSSTPILQGSLQIIDALNKLHSRLSNLQAGCWYALCAPDSDASESPTALELIPCRKQQFKRRKVICALKLSSIYVLTVYFRNGELAVQKHKFQYLAWESLRALTCIESHENYSEITLEECSDESDHSVMLAKLSF